MGRMKMGGGEVGVEVEAAAAVSATRTKKRTSVICFLWWNEKSKR
jgi:hypothetical protein